MIDFKFQFQMLKKSTFTNNLKNFVNHKSSAKVLTLEIYFFLFIRTNIFDVLFIDNTDGKQ